MLCVGGVLQFHHNHVIVLTLTYYFSLGTKKHNSVFSYLVSMRLKSIFAHSYPLTDPQSVNHTGFNAASNIHIHKKDQQNRNMVNQEK